MQGDSGKDADEEVEDTEEEGKDGQKDSGHVKKKGGRYSKNPKGSIPSKPITLSFYPELWCKVLDFAKARMRLYIAAQDGFPRLEKAIEGECREVLNEVITYCEQNKWEVEQGYYPCYKVQMTRLIFNDTHTFHSDIKKSVMKFIRPGYDLFPPSTTKDDDEQLAVMIRKANHLLTTSSYLRSEPDEQGKASNFVHPVLKDVVLDTFYSNSSKSLWQFFEFQEAVPYKALLLVAATVHALLCLFRTFGFVDKKAVKLQSQSVQTAYNELIVQMEAVLNNDYHGAKLDKLLQQWAQVGMAGYMKKYKAATASHKEFTVILD